MIGSNINYILFKANVAIQICNNLTILERKFFNIIAHYILKNPCERIYSIPSFEFRNLMGDIKYNQTTAKIRKILNNLRVKKIELIKPTNISFDDTGFISRASLDVRGVVHIEVSQGLKDFLNIENAKKNGGYTELNLNILNKLHSTHSLALYELLKSKSFAKLSMDIDFQELLLALSKPKENKKGKISTYYQSYYRFNDDILKRAVAEINEKTDLNIEYVAIKFNSKVESIKFIVKKQNTKQILDNHIQELKQTLQPIQNQNIKPLDIDLSQYPKEIEEIINIGIKPAKKVLDWYKEDAKRLLANWFDINNKYHDKSNIEKAKLMAYLWKVNANFMSRAEIEEKEKEMAYNIKKQAELKEKENEQLKKKEENNQKIIKALEETADMYNKLSDTEKLELCRKVCGDTQGVLELKKCKEDNKYLDFNKLSKMYQNMIMQSINPQEIENIDEVPKNFPSYKENEKIEAEKSLKRLFGKT